MPPYPAKPDWEVAICADEAALKIKLNAMRTAETEFEKIIFHPGTGFAVTYLRPMNSFGSSANINTVITDPIITPV
jgi:hypothetical protein